MPEERLIQVQGHGEVEAAPNVAVINLGVVSREAEARAVMQASARKMEAILAAVREQGVPDRGIQTSQINLFLEPQTNVYNASHHLTVQTDTVEMAGAILDAGVEAGANASGGINFTITDDSEYVDRALQLAIADARRKAETLARALNLSIDHVERVTASEAGVMQGGPGHARLLRSLVAPPSPVEVGRLIISANVQVTYAFH